MQNIVVLYKLDDGTICCKQLTEKGLEYVNDGTLEDLGYWEEGGTITLDELEEILNKER
jgi:hypothetical protein